MQAYLKSIAAFLNVLLIVFALIIIANEANPIGGRDLLFAILLIVTPAFTLFALFTPPRN
jgi:hypothetical protein